MKKRKVLLCAGAGCIASGSLLLKKALERKIKEENLDVEVIETGCLGPCAQGPVIVIHPEQTFYQRLKIRDVDDIVLEHLKKGLPVERLLPKDVKSGKPVFKQDENIFFKRQTKVVLKNCGCIDPLRIEDYVKRNGYKALEKVLAMKPEEVIAQVKKAGLRGRGGAGFPTGVKWTFARKAQGNVKYTICNADEGDPGAFMDRSILEGDPHSVIEGMAIAGYAIGASRGFVYVRAEYPLTVTRLTKAIEHARQAGFLGKNILNSGFDFDMEIRMGSGAFVCGEETALIHSIEGKRGEPRPRPPFPAQKGLWNSPSLLNNVETYANIPPILLNGAEWYIKMGTETSRGTKVFALAGAIKIAGLVEVPIGTPLRDVIFDIGGGIKGRKQFKAAQIGGPSGGCIPKEYLDVPLDYKPLEELGAIMGSGGLIVMDETSCMVDVAKFFLEFVQDESCGKCVPCRVGTKRMLEILERICSGEGKEGDVEKLVELGKQIKETSLCGLGQTAPNPVLSTIRHFRHEYDQHIREHHCAVGVCPALVRASGKNAGAVDADVSSLLGKKRYETIKLHR